MIVFYNFLNSFVICLEFSITHWVGTNETIVFIFVSLSAISYQFLLEKKPQLFFSNFLNFFAIFYEFSITRRFGTKRNDNFYFPCFSVYSNLLCLEMSHNDIFKFSEFFFYFFGIFFYASGNNETER